MKYNFTELAFGTNLLYQYKSWHICFPERNVSCFFIFSINLHLQIVPLGKNFSVDNNIYNSRLYNEEGWREDVSKTAWSDGGTPGVECWQHHIWSGRIQDGANTRHAVWWQCILPCGAWRINLIDLLKGAYFYGNIKKRKLNVPY